MASSAPLIAPSDAALRRRGSLGEDTPGRLREAQEQLRAATTRQTRQERCKWVVGLFVQSIFLVPSLFLSVVPLTKGGETLAYGAAPYRTTIGKLYSTNMMRCLNEGLAIICVALLAFYMLYVSISVPRDSIWTKSWLFACVFTSIGTKTCSYVIYHGASIFGSTPTSLDGAGFARIVILQAVFEILAGLGMPPIAAMAKAVQAQERGAHDEKGRATAQAMFVARLEVFQLPLAEVP